MRNTWEIEKLGAVCLGACCACRKALEKHESLICARKLGQSETTDSPANNSQVFRVLQFSFTISVLVCLHFEHETHIGHKCCYCLNSQVLFKVLCNIQKHKWHLKWWFHLFSECVKTVGQKAKGILWEKICLEGCLWPRLEYNLV